MQYIIMLFPTFSRFETEVKAEYVRIAPFISISHKYFSFIIHFVQVIN